MMKRLEHFSHKERQRAGTVKPREDKAQGGFHLCVQISEGRE